MKPGAQVLELNRMKLGGVDIPATYAVGETVRVKDRTKSQRITDRAAVKFL
jgi:hypothetical protein